jgi:hypothetical protein
MPCFGTADLRNYWTEFHETWWSYRYMFQLCGKGGQSHILRGSKSDRSPLEEQVCIFKIFEMSAIFKMAAKTRHKKMGGKNSTLSDIIKI